MPRSNHDLPKDVPGGLFNLRVFRSPAFTIYCFATLVAFFEIYTSNGSPISKKKMLTDPYHDS